MQTFKKALNKPRLAALFLACSPLLGGCTYLPSWAGGEKSEEPKLEGERVAVVAVAPELNADPALQAAPLQLPAASANEEWPQHTGNFNAATSNLALTGHLENSNSATAGEGEGFSHMLIPRPVAGGGRVFAMDAAGYISAHALSDIDDVQWRIKGVSEEDEDDTLGGGLAYDNGILYAVSGRGVVAAYDAATGQEKWRKSLRTPLRSAPRVGAGRIFIVTLNNQLLALSAADGEMLWTHRGISESAGLMNAVSPNLAGEQIVFAPYSSGEVYALSVADGKEIWADSLSGGKHTQASALLSGIGGDPVVDGGVVISVSSGGTVSVQAAATGQTSWQRPIGSLNTPWLTGDSLFMVTNTNALVHFHKFDGKIRWATQLPRFESPEDRLDPITLRGPVMVNGQLAVVASHGELYLISAETGQITQTLEVPENIFTAPIVANGQMILITQDATLYSLR